MSNPVFITHVDWKVKTPFISYSDAKFVKELESINIYYIVTYFENRQKIKHIKCSRICNYFININNKKKIERQKILEKEEKRDKITLWSSLLKCLVL